MPRSNMLKTFKGTFTKKSPDPTEYNINCINFTQQQFKLKGYEISVHQKAWTLAVLVILPTQNQQ